jgi:hypothetical protein
MKTLRNYEVAGALLLGGTGVPAAVGDQVTMFLDTDANGAFPESITGIIQHPITAVKCGSYTSYNIEYDEADLDGAANFLHVNDVVDAVLVTQGDLNAAAIAAETAARIAADLLSVKLSGADQTVSANVTFSNQLNISGDIVFKSGMTFSFEGTSLLDLREVLGINTYADLTAANAALNAGDIYYDTALGRIRSATA